MPPKSISNHAIYIEGCEFKGIPDFTVAKVIRLYGWVINYCPNRKIVHLIRHGKNKRIRNKNFKRALRIIGKEINHD